MLALILVGGEGTRLRPLTYDTPKPMLPILGRPMIARVLEWLASHGVDRVVFSLGYRPDAFVFAFPENSFAGVELAYAVEPEPLDTAGAIRFAAIAAGCEPETMIVVNGDILTDLDLGGLLEFHRRHGGEATISLTPVEDPSSYGVVPTEDDGKVLAFIEKPSAEDAPTKLINAGIYVFEPAVLDRIAGDRRVSIEREVFPALVTDGQLYAQPSQAYWLDTGTPERYLQAQLDILRGLRPSVVLPEHNEWAPGVRLAPDIDDAAEYAGHVFVEGGAVIEAGARIENAVIGRRVTVASGARICNSLILEGAAIEKDAAIDDSIVGAGARIGAGAVLRGMTVVGAGAQVVEGTYLDSARMPV